MISNTIHELKSLRKGMLDLSQAPTFEGLSAATLIHELHASHPFVFQQRTIGKKVEIGIAKRISYELVFRRRQDSLLPSTRLHPILADCYLISAYNDVLSEITWARRIHVRPASGNRQELRLPFGKGYKLDKTVDGWQVKTLLRRSSSLSEQLLRTRGWQFDLLPPFHVAKP